MIFTKATAFLAAALVAAPVSGVLVAADGKPADRMVKPLTPMGYLQQAAMADLFEIQSSKLALETASDKAVKSFAQMMIRDHSKTTQMIEKAAQSEAMPANTKLELPTRLDPGHQALMKKLEAAKGSEFDRLYMDTQLEVHQRALDLHRSYAETGENASLRKMASQIAEDITRHLKELERFTKAGGRQR